MASDRATHSHAPKDQPPPIDPGLQSKLVAKFGARLMKLGFTALPVLVQKHYRSVPGTLFQREVVDEETGEIMQVNEASFMTPTEYAIMTAIWSYWWTNQSTPWPSVLQICLQVGKSERQVRRYLQRLRDKGFMLSLEQYNGEGKQISNRYDFTPFLKRLIAFLEEREAPAEPVHESPGDDKNGREWMSDTAGSGCQNRHPKQIESKTHTLKEDESNSSGSAATQKGTVLPPTPPCSHIAHRTIRTEDETHDTQEIESDRNTNRPPTSQENGRAARAKDAGEVEKENMGGIIETCQERGAAAAGIAPDHLERLEQGTRKRPDVPFFIEACLEGVSRLLNDAQPNSSITQASTLYAFYAGQCEGFGEDEFRKHLSGAFGRAKRLLDEETTVRRSNGKANKMPALFGALKASLRREYGIEPLAKGAEQRKESQVVAALPALAPDGPLSAQEPREERGQDRPRRPGRTPEQKEARARYAEWVRTHLRLVGAAGALEMIVGDYEHTCGCSLFHRDWTCVRCRPASQWDQEIRDLIETIMHH